MDVYFDKLYQILLTSLLILNFWFFPGRHLSNHSGSWTKKEEKNIKASFKKKKHKLRFTRHARVHFHSSSLLSSKSWSPTRSSRLLYPLATSFLFIIFRWYGPFSAPHSQIMNDIHFIKSRGRSIRIMNSLYNFPYSTFHWRIDRRTRFLTVTDSSSYSI